jgi:paraquat-inducible protein A
MHAETWQYNERIHDTSLLACPHCDLLQHLPDLEQAGSASCPRCGKELYRHREDSLNRTRALALAAAVLYVVANAVPMLGLTIVGRGASTTVLGGAEHLWRDGPQMVGLLVLFTAIIAPGLQICFMLAIVLGVLRTRPPSWIVPLLRMQPTARTWSMIEVMLLGVLVALKIEDYAKVIPGAALFTLGALVFVLAAMEASFDPGEIWSRVVWAAENDTLMREPLEEGR